MSEVLGLLDEITEVARASEGLFRGIEQVIGLPAGEVHAPPAVAHGTSPVREVARRIGELDDAAGATIEKPDPTRIACAESSRRLKRRFLRSWLPASDRPGRRTARTDAGVQVLLPDTPWPKHEMIDGSPGMNVDRVGGDAIEQPKLSQ